MTLALRALRGRVRSSEELAQALAVQGIPLQDIPRIVRECERRGILDDRAAARLWAGHWARLGYGWAAIHHRLSAKGLGEAVIDEAAGRLKLGTPDDEEARARAWLAAAKRRRAMTPAQLARRLLARGFEPELVERLVPRGYDE